jgi:hypothetical protein
MRTLDGLYTDAIVRLFPGLADLPNLHVHLKLHIEDGGLGFFPYHELHSKLSDNLFALSQEMFYEVGLPADPEQAVDDRTISHLWRHIHSTFLQQNPDKKWSIPDERSWLQTIPTNSLLAINDTTFETAILHRLNWIQPFEYFCPLTQKNLNQLPRNEVAHHLNTCLHCGASSFRLRHELVAHAIVKTARYHLVTSEVNPTDLPLPGKKKGGPDFMFWGSTVYAGDVCITANNPATVFANKKRKYIDFVKTTGATCLPFAMSVQGTIEPRSRELIHQVQHVFRLKGFAADVFRYSTIACISGNALGIQRIQNRDPLVTLLNLQLAQQNQSDDENDDLLEVD